MEIQFWPTYRLSLNTNNAEAIKTSKCVVGVLQAANVGAAKAYVKLYDKATTPAATDTPKVVLMLPITSGNIALPIPEGGLTFGSGLGIRIVTGIADSDDTAVPANEIIVNLGIG